MSVLSSSDRGFTVGKCQFDIGLNLTENTRGVPGIPGEFATTNFLLPEDPVQVGVSKPKYFSPVPSEGRRRALVRSGARPGVGTRGGRAGAGRAGEGGAPGGEEGALHGDAGPSTRERGARGAPTRRSRGQ